MKWLMALLMCILIVPCLGQSVEGAISPLAPLFTFEMSVQGEVWLDGNATEIELVTLHESSSSWLLYLRRNSADVYPYDNISISISCNDASSPTTFYSTDYTDWVNNGSIAVNFNFQDESYDIYYNEIDFTGKQSDCEISADSVAFYNNSAYNTIDVEMIPYLGVLEFISCTGVDSAQIGIADEMNSMTTMMADIWDIAWIVYSIGIVVVGVFGIPILVFMLIRWAIYKLSGIKLIERKER
jgi:hypothetical protein